jgi:hypothetical protein
MYVFVTAPDLNFTTAGTAALNSAIAGSAATILGLGSPLAPIALANWLTGGQGFIPILTNLAKSYQAQDISLDTHQVGEGWEGAKQTVARSTLNSRQDGQLQIEYVEWSGTPILLLHKIWVDYIDAVGRGQLSPKAIYIANKILDYACSIYAFQTLPDGVTIEWGARWTGCFPTVQPHSGWSGRIGGTDAVSATVSYSYSFYEPMVPVTFGEFNIAAASCGVGITTTNPNLMLGATADQAAAALSAVAAGANPGAGVFGATRTAFYLSISDSISPLSQLIANAASVAASTAISAAAANAASLS